MRKYAFVLIALASSFVSSGAFSKTETGIAGSSSSVVNAPLLVYGGPQIPPNKLLLFVSNQFMKEDPDCRYDTFDECYWLCYGSCEPCDKGGWNKRGFKCKAPPPKMRK